ncbi:ExeM/NucH family extracellular endonuclease [Changpingibacter yushuensis]|uniref:ExeM/NucH family extracellular endonuclease n=1 Tax=Changpingibacter yushuensis TaxID=2758440 RepID=UPI00165E7FF0|nr:ExeM/NucH family extracellular endonuclease [Changpingibacter yushuensis]
MTAAAAVVAATFSTVPATASPAGDAVVINEINVSGKYVELYNPTSQAISLDGVRVGYYGASGTLQCQNNGTLTGTVPANGYYLIHMATAFQANLPGADQLWGCDATLGKNGGFAIGNGALPATATGGNIDYTSTNLIDFVGLGTNKAFETSAAAAPSSGSSISRAAGADSDNNKSDFAEGAPTPTNSKSETAPSAPTPDPTPTSPAPTTDVVTPIASIQGTGAASPVTGTTVTTEGYVTAVYPAGGFNGLYLQTAGTGGGTIHSGASDGIFIYAASSGIANSVQIGDYVSVTGAVSEYYNLTQVTASSYAKKAPPEGVAVPAAVELEALPGSDNERESLEGMLVKITGDMTVTNNYQTNQYGTIGVAMGDEPLRQPTDVLNPTRDGESAVQALEDQNNARLITLDDGMTTNFLSNATNKAIPVSWLTLANEVRTGAAVTQTQPAVLDYRNSTWGLQPLKPLTSASGQDLSALSFDFSSTRPDSSPEVGGDISISSFNVLNYFTTTAADVGCTSTYSDRAGTPITANSCDTVRGAATDESLNRQQAKIVAAINKLDSSVVSLEEIENSAKNGFDRDYSVDQLVAALNTAAGYEKWEAVASPSLLPDLSEEDVIRLAFIYQPKEVEPIGDSEVLIGASAFSNAREPLAQTWQAVDESGEPYGDDFVVVVNHFKSKGSGTAAPDKWQGNANSDRVAQAETLTEWIADEWANEPVFIVGDLNSYSAEDPILTLNDAGYTRVMQHLADTENDDSYLSLTTYQYSGLMGSLDQALGNEAALDMVTDAGVYSINADESLAREYSRYNYNVTLLYDTSEFRSSDHDPVKIGVNVDGDDGETIIVEAAAPTYADGVITIPSVEGVVYLVNGELVTGTVEVASGQTVVVTAEAVDGYALADGSTSSWSFTHPQDPDTSGVVPVVDGSVGVNVFFQDSLVRTVTEFAAKVGSADEVLSGDFDGDGVDTLVLRTGRTYTFVDANRSGASSYSIVYGPAGSVPVVGDFDGDGSDDVAVKAASSNRFYVRFSVDGRVRGGSADLSVAYGKASDVPLAGDWDGDGVAGLGVQRGSRFLVKQVASGGSADVVFTFGRVSDRAVVGDFDGDGADSVSVVRGTRVFVNDRLAGGSRPGFVFGRSSDQVVAGDWFGSGSDTLAAYRK